MLGKGGNEERVLYKDIRSSDNLPSPYSSSIKSARRIMYNGKPQNRTEFVQGVWRASFTVNCECSCIYWSFVDQCNRVLFISGGAWGSFFTLGKR